MPGVFTNSFPIFSFSLIDFEGLGLYEYEGPELSMFSATFLKRQSIYTFRFDYG